MKGSGAGQPTHGANGMKAGQSPRTAIMIASYLAAHWKVQVFSTCWLISK